VPINDDITKVSYEVLSRLKMKDDSITLPGSFLPAAERYNSSRRIDMHVVTKLFDWLVNHLAVLDTINVFTVNLSGHSVGDRAVLDFVVSELKRTGIPGNKIKFEITETATISNLTEATHFIETLSTYGCNFVLDDFGSGLSSFGYLKNLQVTGIKIDGMFVKDILNDPFDLEMVKSINDIGHVMGLETIAEFVETQEVLDKLKTIGVDSVQGYLLGKPMPIDDILL
jgi:EAL domain-containing protein (putative c-di-GMP-specific phosphodiesterase class I)